MTRSRTVTDSVTGSNSSIPAIADAAKISRARDRPMTVSVPVSGFMRPASVMSSAVRPGPGGHSSTVTPPADPEVDGSVDRAPEAGHTDAVRDDRRIHHPPPGPTVGLISAHRRAMASWMRWSRSYTSPETSGGSTPARRRDRRWRESGRRRERASRRNGRLKRYRIKQQTKVAVAEARGRAKVDDPALRRDTGKLLAQHESTDARWLDYEMDVAKLLDFPMMTDMREPLTVAFHKARSRADLLRPVGDVDRDAALEIATPCTTT